jgi:Holliday junction resolvase RusA-like endonuclease
VAEQALSSARNPRQVSTDRLGLAVDQRAAESVNIVCALPWPPTVNHAWRPTSRGGKILSDEYKAFKKAVGDYVLEHRVPRFKLKGTLGVAMLVRPPNTLDFDIDNRVKCCLDALAGAGVIENDRFVDLLFVARGKPFPSGVVWIRLEEVSAGNFSALKHFADEVFAANLTGLANPAILSAHDTAEVSRINHAKPPQLR